MTKVGTIFNIQRFSIIDGPGIRTVVFFKGCNLNCMWCHNSESILFEKQLEYIPSKCIGCGACFEVCSQNAHYIENNVHKIDRDLCKRCFKCVDVCYAEALSKVGVDVELEYLQKAILTDMPYYKKSGGGVTFSGGECMLQIDFLKDILEFCKDNSIHTAVDTAGAVPWESFEKILDFTDLFLYDIKTSDSQLHKNLTNMGNETIINNLRRLTENKKRIIIRVPYIIGANENEIEGIALMLESLDIKRVDLLPFHKLGASKYGSLDIVDTSQDFKIPTKEEILVAVDVFKKYNIVANIF